MVTMLPAGGSPRGFAELPQARFLHQVHALLRRRGQARHPLRRSVRVSCVRVHAWLGGWLSRRRAGCGVLCITAVRAALFASTRRSHPIGSFLNELGALSGGLALSASLLTARVFHRISRFGASKRPKFSGLAGAHGHRLELGLYTRKNRPLAELVEPAERHTICSHSKKSAM